MQIKTGWIVAADWDPLIIDNGSVRNFQRSPMIGVNRHIIRMIQRGISRGIGISVRGVGTIIVTSLEHRLSCFTAESIARATRNIVAQVIEQRFKTVDVVRKKFAETVKCRRADGLLNPWPIQSCLSKAKTP